MSTKDTSLHLLAPGLLGPMPALTEPGDFPRLLALELLLARAERRKCSGKDFESTLLSLCKHPVRPGEDLPLGALYRIADGLVPEERYWFMVEPVLLRPDQDRLLLFDSVDLAFSLDEARVLEGLFSAHFAEEGLRLEVATAQRWYLSPDQTPSLTTSSMGDVFGRNMDMFLPEGPDALRWRALLNEVQMLFFECGINQQRETQGKLPINGIWLSGGGCLPGAMSQQYDRFYTDHPLARGVALCTKTPLVEISSHPSPILAGSGRILATYTQLNRPVWRADPGDWLEALRTFDEWFRGLLQGIKGHQLKSLFVYPCNGQVYRLNARRLMQFWKRGRSVAGQLDRRGEFVSRWLVVGS